MSFHKSCFEQGLPRGLQKRIIKILKIPSKHRGNQYFLYDENEGMIQYTIAEFEEFEDQAKYDGKKIRFTDSIKDFIRQ